MEKSDNSNAPAQKPAEEKSFVGTLKDNSLKAAGLAYLVGDAAIIASGVATGNKARRNTGLAWGLGGAFPALFGNPSEEKQLRMVSEGLGDYLRKQGVTLPDDPNIAELTKEGGAVEHVLGFFSKHPSESLNAIYALGATQMVSSGLKSGSQSATARADIASGLLVGAGALSGLFIKEKAPDPDHPAQDTLGKIKQWAQEKPLRVSGVLYGANNVAMLSGAVSEWKKSNGSASGSKDYRLRFLTAGTYIFANVMLSMSSKGHGGSDGADVTAQVADLSAKIIAAQPKAVQEALIQNVAGYLSSQPEMDKTAEEIAHLLHNKLQSVDVASSSQLTWQERTQAVTSQPNSPQIT